MAPGVRALLAALAAAVWLAAPARARAQTPVSNQEAFEAGMTFAARGDWAAAIAILRGLAERTDAPRVRLELARVYYLSGDYRRAKAEFLKVYRQDIPYPVRRSINVFLDEIDQRIGYIQPSLGLVADSNPGRTASSGTYDILGAPFDYRQPDHRRYGLAWRVAGVRPLTAPEQRQWVLTGAAEGQSFGERDLDFGVYSAAVRLDDHKRNARISLGWRFHDQPSSDASGPYVEYYRRLTSRADRQTIVQASLEHDRYADLPELSGVTAALAVDRARDIGPRTSGHVTVGGSVSSVRDSRLPSGGAFVVVGASRSLPSLNTSVVANASFAGAWYGQRDPFFGQTRRDGTARVEAAFYVARPVFGLFPGVAASAERRTSSIDFYGYRRSGVSIDFRRRF